MRRDLEIDFDPAQIVLEPPDRSQLREMFRRYEFRALLNRVDELEEAVPRRRRPVAGAVVPWREGELPAVRGRVGLAVADGRFALAQEDGVVVGAWDEARPPGCRARRPRLQVAAALDDAAGRRHADRGVPDRAGALRIQDRGPAARVRARGCARPGGRGRDRSARHPRRSGAPPRRADARAARRARLGAALRRDRAAAHRRPRRDGGRGRQDRHLPDGRDHGAAGRPRRGARGEGARARGRGVHARLDAAGRPHPLREAAADARAQGQDGLLDRHARSPLDPRRARDRPRARGVARALEADQHLPRPAAAADLRARRPPTRPSTRRRRRRDGSRRRTRTCRRSRSGPSSGARSAPPSSPSRVTG